MKKDEPGNEGAPAKNKGKRWTFAGRLTTVKGPASGGHTEKARVSAFFSSINVDSSFKRSLAAPSAA